MRPGLPSLRSAPFVREFRKSLATASERHEFRVTHYAFQREHAHLIVEAKGKAALGRGMRSIAARLARALNRVSGQRGPVLDSRYEARVLPTPRDVRQALAYVLVDTQRQHATGEAPRRLEAASSARWFDGWTPEWRERLGEADGEVEESQREVALPRTWLLRAGWRRYGLLDPSEPADTSDTPAALVTSPLARPTTPPRR